MKIRHDSAMDLDLRCAKFLSLSLTIFFIIISHSACNDGVVKGE